MSFSFDSGARGRARRGPWDAAPGPFKPQVNDLLVRGFDQPLDGIEVVRNEGATNQAMNAEAHTIGSRISLGDHIEEDPSDAFSMEVIAHEVAHALAGGGSGERAVSDARTDPGEHAAHAASDSFRDFIAGGAMGAVPRLTPAHGGRARIHRYTAGEHADQVDATIERLEADGEDIDPAVRKLLETKITLGNGVTLTPGEITALTGDFYAVYDRDKDAKGKDHYSVNAEKSFEALNSADPEEMVAILEKVRAEQQQIDAIRKFRQEHPGQELPKELQFEPSDDGELNEITHGRHQVVDADGSVHDMSYAELADANSSHFSKATMEGTDNNMGAYAAFHQMALAAAASGDPGKMQQAAAMEAAGQHFMTDRFASGHQFDKDAVMDAAAANHGTALDELKAMLSSRDPEAIARAVGAPDAAKSLWAGYFHDQANEGVDPLTGGTDGVQVSDGDECWKMLGDGHYIDEGNEENRRRASRASYASFLEIARAQAGDDVASINEESMVSAMVPQWNQELQDNLEAQSRDLTMLPIMKERFSSLPAAQNSAGFALSKLKHDALEYVRSLGL